MDLMQDLVVNKTCIDLAPKIGEFGPSDLSEQIIENWSIEVYTIPDDRLSGVPRRYALCFYGSHKSLKHVLSSIKCNVFKPITGAGDTYDVFVHTFHDDIPGEDGQQQLSADENIMLLEPVSSYISSLNDFNKTLSSDPELPIILEYYVDSATGMELLHDQHSRIRVWDIMVQYSKSQRINYDGVISLRLDAAYLNEVDIQNKNIPPQKMYLPINLQSPATASAVGSPGHIGSTHDITTNYHYNTLFAYGNFDAMRTCMVRSDNIELVEHHSKAHHVTAEQSLLHALKKAQVNVKQARISVIQVLPNGTVSPKDVEICESFVRTKCSTENLKF